MRMIRGRLDARGERGVVAAMVIVTIFVLMGMLVLAIDVGGLLLKHRGMVNSNDSAALAAAISFAKNQSSIADPSVAMAQADSFAGKNQGDAVRYPAPSGDPAGPAPDGFKAVGGIEGSSCDPAKCGTVTVWFLGHTSVFFAQIFGHGQDVSIHERAQAIWGPAGGGQPNPIMIRYDWMQNSNEQICDKPVPPPDDEIDIKCRFWLDDTGIGNAQWSFLNLIPWDPNDSGKRGGWDVPRYDSQIFPGCANVGDNIIKGWIDNSIPTGNLDLRYPDPTYVCRVTGHADAAFVKLKAQEGHFRVFPVNDAAGQVDDNGNLCPPPCTPAKYDIIGFTILRIDQVLEGKDDAAIGDPGSQNNLCPVIRRDFTNIPGLNHTYDLDSQTQCGLLNLHFPGDATKLYPRIRPSNGNTPPFYNYGPAPGPNVDYTYDPATHEITWVSVTNPSVTNVRVDWEYDIAPTPGACGVRERNANAVCMVASWQGFQSGGVNPGDGADMGLRAVRLSE